MAESDASAALAAILTVAARHAIPGPTPLFAVTAPTPGSGKTLLTDVIAIIGTGVPAARFVYADDDDETRKRLLAVGATPSSGAKRSCSSCRDGSMPGRAW